MPTDTERLDWMDQTKRNVFVQKVQQFGLIQGEYFVWHIAPTEGGRVICRNNLRDCVDAAMQAEEKNK